MSKIVQENASQKKKKEILNRWTKYCSELYKASGGPSELNCPQTDIEDDHPILRKEVAEEREVSWS